MTARRSRPPAQKSPPPRRAAASDSAAPLEFFDCDLMLGSPLRTGLAGYDAASAVAELARCGVTQALVYGHALGPDAFATQNRIALDAASAQPRLHACVVLPQFPLRRGQRVLSLVRELVATGARAFRLEREVGPASGALELERFPDAAACWSLLARKRLPLFVPAAHFPVRDSRFAYGLDDVVALCRRHPTLPVVLLHAPYAIERQLYTALARAKNLHLAITRFGLFGQLESFVAEFGAERFLFGSGAPWNDPAIARGAVAYAALPLAQRRQIAGGNLRRLLRLP
ncbi:MAG: amidohydrolase family protein [Candidatus Didemnitutus sp.]|nr:amidohydrolase family protein [Candidatus Didemnitutus sp.]